MTLIIAAIVFFFIGLYLGMWLTKHPEDAHEYEERAIAKIKSLVRRGEKAVVQQVSGMDSPKGQHIPMVSSSSSGDSTAGNTTNPSQGA